MSTKDEQTGGAKDKEIEAKYLVVGDAWREEKIESASEIKQGYLTANFLWPVRIRVQDGRAVLTIKGQSSGLEQTEKEFDLTYIQKPEQTAKHALEVLKDFAVYLPIEKIRHVIPLGPFKCEVDEFTGANAGLVVAEVEFAKASDKEKFEKDHNPEWLGEEVTGDFRYRNNQLSKSPFTTWKAI